MIPIVWKPSRSMLGQRRSAVSFILGRGPRPDVPSRRMGGPWLPCGILWVPRSHVASSVSVLVSSCCHIVGDSSWLTSINMQILSRRLSLVTKNEVDHSSKPRQLRYTQLTVVEGDSLFLSLFLIPCLLSFFLSPSLSLSLSLLRAFALISISW